MMYRINDMENCETCNHCMSVHLEKDGNTVGGLLHYCKLCKRIVDKGDKCRRWQRSELLREFEQEDMSVILARLKEKFDY